MYIAVDNLQLEGGVCACGGGIAAGAPTSMYSNYAFRALC